MKSLRQSLALLVALAALLVPSAAWAEGPQPPSFDPFNRQAPGGTEGGMGCRTVTLNSGSDTWLNSQAPSRSYGSDAKLAADGNPPSSALIRWDLSTIPAGRSITRAMIMVAHIDPKDESATRFKLYTLRREWSEADATWLTASAGQAWAAAGAADPTRDRGSVAIGQTPITRGSPGIVPIELNAEGLAQVERWVNGSEPNYGLAFQEFRSGDAFRFGSFESKYPPRLVLTHCAGKLEARAPGMSR